MHSVMLLFICHRDPHLDGEGRQTHQPIAPRTSHGGLSAHYPSSSLAQWSFVRKVYIPLPEVLQLCTWLPLKGAGEWYPDLQTS